MMKLLFAALGADAQSLGSRRRRPAHATSSAATASLSCSLSSWRHGVLLSLSALHQAKVPSTPITAAGHGKIFLLKSAVQPGPNDLIQITGHKGKHRNAGRGQQSEQGPGNRSANQGTHLQFQQPLHPLSGKVLGKEVPAFANNAPGFFINDVQMPGRVKYRRDPLPPEGKSGSHGASLKEGDGCTHL